LPYNNYLYKIDYDVDISNKDKPVFILTIDAAEGFRNNAIKQIYNFGLDPGNYRIVFLDYSSPFGGETNYHPSLQEIKGQNSVKVEEDYGNDDIPE
jgi:hypothetical protein